MSHNGSCVGSIAPSLVIPRSGKTTKTWGLKEMRSLESRCLEGLKEQVPARMSFYEKDGFSLDSFLSGPVTSFLHILSSHTQAFAVRTDAVIIRMRPRNALTTRILS